MFDRLRTWLLQVLRVPPEPEPPFGAPGSVRVFRAARNFYKLRLLVWGLAQAGALAGIVFSHVFLNRMEQGFHGVAAAVQSASTNAASRIAATNESGAQTAVAPGAQQRERSARNAEREKRAKEAFTRWAWVPLWTFSALSLLEIVGVGIYVLQAFLTYAALRLDYELRWYIVTDRSLRIRSGIWRVQEMTMSFANLQHVMLSQGPLQRLLGIADVRVQSAGGGVSQDSHGHSSDNSMHAGVFQGVDNASEVRDLMLNRLRQFREAGLGDPDEHTQPTPVPSIAAVAPSEVADSNAEVLAAARELLAEARQLRNKAALS